MSVRDQLVGGDALRRKIVEHDDLPPVEVREVRAKDMVELADVDEDDAKSVVAETVKRCVFDPETGERVFGDEDDEAIGEVPVSWLMAVYRAAEDLSDMDAFDVEDEAGN